jgi:hypothetical protein
LNGGRLPDFVIIGAMKAATSTLAMQLSQQPGILMATPKEPNFFSDAAIWDRGLDWYRHLFAAAPTGALCGEASTHYTKLPTYPEALPRLRATMPDVRLIYMMRHPVDRLISHYRHGWLERSMAGPLDAAIDRHVELVDYGRYAMQIAPWLDAFGPADILPVFMEKLIAEPQGELERVCRFLGYERAPLWHAGIAAQNVSTERLRDSAWRDSVIDNRLAAWLRRTLVPRPIRNRIKYIWQMRDRPTIGEAVLARITAAFDEDLQRLGGMLGAPLDCASYNRTVRERTLDWV